MCQATKNLHESSKNVCSPATPRSFSRTLPPCVFASSQAPPPTQLTSLNSRAPSSRRRTRKVSDPVVVIGVRRGERSPYAKGFVEPLELLAMEEHQGAALDQPCAEPWLRLCVVSER
jgi:hypothetical protein